MFYSQLNNFWFWLFFFLPPAETHNLQSLHTILSTGSPLKPQSYDYVYRCIKSNVLLGSISGDGFRLLTHFCHFSKNSVPSEGTHSSSFSKRFCCALHKPISYTHTVHANQSNKASAIQRDWHTQRKVKARKNCIELYIFHTTHNAITHTLRPSQPIVVLTGI